VNPPRSATVFTHRRPAETAPAVAELLEAASRAGVVLRFDTHEARKHRLGAREGVEVDSPVVREVDMCFALGGDGTILSALREYAGTAVPVFAVNFGEIGFLATVDREQTESGLRRAFAGDFEVLALPGIEASGQDGPWLAINDLAMHRQAGKRVANLMYSVGRDEVGRVHCDGLVAAPGDVLVVHNASREEPVDVVIDGRPVGVLAPAEQITVTFHAQQGTLAQIPGTTFYHRLREKFGRLVSPL